MNNSKIVLVLIAIIIIFSAIFLFYHELQPIDKVEVGNTYIHLPNGCSAIKVDDAHVNITKNGSSLLFTEYRSNGTDVESVVNNYVDLKQNESQDCNLNKMNMSGTLVFKTIILNDTNIVHYWFVKNGKIYEIGTHDGNTIEDKFISEIVASLEFKS